MECGGYPTGVVDRVEKSLKSLMKRCKRLPEDVATSISQEYMTGVGMLDNRLIILLDIDKVLSKSDLSELEGAANDGVYAILSKNRSRRQGYRNPSDENKRNKAAG